tara:strand:- start:203649 stop:204128 length:480 start_codon:yes stop_codon:yes gene_type:complete
MLTLRELKMKDYSELQTRLMPYFAKHNHDTLTINDLDSEDKKWLRFLLETPSSKLFANDGFVIPIRKKNFLESTDLDLVKYYYPHMNSDGEEIQEFKISICDGEGGKLIIFDSLAAKNQFGEFIEGIGDILDATAALSGNPKVGLFQKIFGGFRKIFGY